MTNARNRIKLEIKVRTCEHLNLGSKRSRSEHDVEITPINMRVGLQNFRYLNGSDVICALTGKPCVLFEGNPPYTHSFPGGYLEGDRMDRCPSSKPISRDYVLEGCIGFKKITETYTSKDSTFFARRVSEKK